MKLTVYVKSMKQVHAYAVELLVFMKRNFKINLEQEPLLLVMESKIIDWERNRSYGDISSRIKC